jgi:5-carboxymethyl-2-hydroxymuconate isomerase
MPHLTVEYSANLEKQIDVIDLLHKVHDAALATRVFELGAVRTRAARRESYVVADDHPENLFVAIWVRVAQGRDAETRRRLGKTIFDTVCNYLEKIYERTPIAISLEVQEIDSTAAFRKNNLHAIVKERAAKTRS